MAPETTTDDEQNGIKSLRDLGGRHGDGVLRHYSADGHLYAYRDGDEHVVVSNGSDRGDRWTGRVPAERTDVEGGEHLWTIPDNWEREVGIERVNGGPHVIYHIPETDQYVRASTPKNNHLVDAWIGIKAVGDELTFEVCETPDRDALDDAVARHDRLAAEHEHDADRNMANKLSTLADRFAAFEAAYCEDAEHGIAFLRDDWASESYTLPADGRKFEHVWSDGIDFGTVFDAVDFEVKDDNLSVDLTRMLVQEDIATHYPAFRPRVV